MNCLGKRTGTATDSGGTLTEYFGALGTPPTPGANALNQYAGIAKIPASGAATLYLYDGWNCIAEYTGATPAVSKTFLWGLDLSGSLQGAGGVGGLLSVSQGGSSFYPTFDGNGNVSEYLASDGEVAAHFEYDPFGNTVVDTDSADQFSYRFSTKPLDFETGLYYYAYRYYDPVTGRWPSRDPIGEDAEPNLYGSVNNDPIDRFDPDGLAPQWHHEFPQEFRDYFKAAGIEIDDPEFGRVFNDQGPHKWDEIHREWNRLWREFIKENPAPDKAKIRRYLDRLRGIEKFREWYDHSSPSRGEGFKDWGKRRDRIGRQLKKRRISSGLMRCACNSTLVSLANLVIGLGTGEAADAMLEAAGEVQMAIESGNLDDAANAATRVSQAAKDLNADDFSQAALYLAIEKAINDACSP